MTNERRQDVLLIALVVSVGLHLAVMFGARSQVMAKVSPPPRSPRHGPLTLREAPPAVAPRQIDFFQDVSADKSAPTASGVTAAPLTEESLPMPAAGAQLASPDVPPPVAQLKIENPLAAVKSAPAAMVTDRVRVAVPMGNLSKLLEHPASELAVAVPPPPAVSSVQSWQLPKSSPVVSVGEAPKLVSQEIAPAAQEVQQAVNAQFVEREKASVRRLIDTDRALDMARAVDLRLEKCVSGGWTYFRITAVPRRELAVVPKDVVVLLDASGSIGYDRLGSCRKAVRRFLRTGTNTGDRFNLVAFRDRFSYAFRSWQECNAASFRAGDKWLANLVAHGRTDVFASIASVLTLPRDPKRPLIALVITDGDANSGISETREILSKFTELNGGLISIYMYGVRGSSNRELIEVLTHGNRGEAVVFDSWKRWNAGEGIEAFSERFRDPLLSDLNVVFAASLRARAYPLALKNLYRGNSATVTGRVPGEPASLDFSLKGQAAGVAYENYFRLPLSAASADPKLPEAFAGEESLAIRVR